MAHFPKKIGASITKGGASVAHFGVQLGAFSKFSSGDTEVGVPAWTIDKSSIEKDS